MTSPAFLQRLCEVQENILLADRTWRIRFECPEIAQLIKPGQFLMLRLPGTTDPLLGRPFALYDTILNARNEPVAIDVVYLVVGKMTGRLMQLRPGDSIEVWGPLGNGFLDVGQPQTVTLVAGGIGQTPFLAYSRELLGLRGYGGRAPKKIASRVALFYGVRTTNLAACVEDFQRVGVDVHLASDDGTIGYHGYVTGLLEANGPVGPIVGCGPEPMLKALIALARQWGVSCQVSLETPMACGIGICFSCVTKVNSPDGNWDYKRVCVDGPVFDADTLG
jgi:dihydroorotate dehydrogenase electron transfer subunit